MDIRSILTVLDGSERSELALKASISLAKLFSAHVDVLRIEPLVGRSLMATGIGLSGMTDSLVLKRLEDNIRERSNYAQRLFEKHCVQAGLNVVEAEADADAETPSFTWHQVSGHDGPEIARRGRLCDLIVMARADEDEGGADSTLLEAALFDTGRPVFITGPTPDAFSGRNVTVAWDGSREAAHSIGLAMPFLTRAENVRIVTINDDEAGADPQALFKYLNRQGIKSNAESISCGGASIAETLLREANSQKCDLLVMGAYGHSAFGEYLFGGVTRSILEKAAVPVAMAH